VKVTRLFTGDDRKSHFEDFDIPLNDKGDIGHLSESVKQLASFFRETTGQYSYDWHNALDVSMS
jgi:hypothetical protein